MGLTYVASPYSDPDIKVRKGRFFDVTVFAAKLMREGKHVFSPICHMHPLAVYGTLPTGWDFWEKYDREILSHCSEMIVLMLPGWRYSKGIAAELAIATELGLPISYAEPDAQRPILEGM